MRKVINEQTRTNTSLTEDVPIMSETDALVTRWITAFNAHNVEQIVALYTDDAELFDTGMKRVRRGQNEIRGWFTQRFQKMPTIHYTPTKNFLQQDDAVVCWIASGHTPALLGQRWLSRPFQVEGVSVFRINAGRIQWQHGYYDHLHVVEQVIPPLRWLPLKL